MESQAENHRQNFEKKQEEKVNRRLLSVREKLIKSDKDKQEEIEALEEKLDERGVKYPSKEEILN